jgi:DNA-binding MarR family transcriptional regulator
MKAILNNDLASNNPYMKMFVRIMKVGRIIENHATEILKEFDITHIQFNVLRSLEVVHPDILSVGEIKKQLLFPASDVTRLLDRLLKNGLIDRCVCPKNRRKVDVSITKKGLELIKKILPEFEKQSEGYFRFIINEDERDQMLVGLARIQNHYLEIGK